MPSLRRDLVAIHGSGEPQYRPGLSRHESRVQKQRHKVALRGLRSAHSFAFEAALVILSCQYLKVSPLVDTCFVSRQASIYGPRCRNGSVLSKTRHASIRALGALQDLIVQVSPLFETYFAGIRSFNLDCRLRNMFTTSSYPYYAQSPPCNGVLV